MLDGRRQFAAVLRQDKQEKAQNAPLTTLPGVDTTHPEKALMLPHTKAHRDAHLEEGHVGRDSTKAAPTKFMGR